MLRYLFADIIKQFARMKLEEKNLDLREKDNVQGQLLGHIFATNGGYLLSLFSLKYF